MSWWGAKNFTAWSIPSFDRWNLCKTKSLRSFLWVDSHFGYVYVLPRSYRERKQRCFVGHNTDHNILAHLRFVTVPGGCVHANERLSDPQKFVTFWTHRETNHITFKVIPLTILHMIHVIIPICPSPLRWGKSWASSMHVEGYFSSLFFFFLAMDRFDQFITKKLLKLWKFPPNRSLLSQCI
jgi:hypothetical protein